MIRQYLLGLLAEEQQQVIEQRLLTEDDLFEGLEVIEDELSDEYVADELTPVDRKQFEQYFLSTRERQRELRFAAGLREYVARQRELRFAAGLREYVAKKTVREDATERSVSVPRRSPPERMPLAWLGQTQLFRIAAIAAFVVVIAGALWFTRPDRHPPASYATFTLTISNNNRAESGPATEVNLPFTADAARLYLKLPEVVDQSARFRVELLKDSGQTINIEKVARVEQAAVIEIPAAQLSRGEYALKIYVVKSDGTEERINGSYFLVVK